MSNDNKPSVEETMENIDVLKTMLGSNKTYVDELVRQNAQLTVMVEALKIQKNQMAQTIRDLEAKIAEGTRVANEELQESCEAMSIKYASAEAEALVAKQAILFLMSGGNPCEVCAKTCKMGEECHPVWKGKSKVYDTKRTQRT